MKGILTQKQAYLLRILMATAVVYLVFQYLLPLVLPFVVALLLALLLRPSARFLYKMFHIPMGIGAGLVLTTVAVTIAAGGYYVGRLAMDQLVRLGQQVPIFWEKVCHWLYDCCGQMEKSLRLADGAVTDELQRMIEAAGEVRGADSLVGGSMVTLMDASLQSALGLLKGIVSLVVVLFVTIGATLITTTQLESFRQAVNHSPFGKEICCVGDVLTRVGVAYGKTQLVIMLCTVVISAVGLTVLGDPYALLWAAIIGVVDALPLFGSGTILWPWLTVSLFRGRWAMAVGLAIIYGISNLTRQWLEARYMGNRIGISPLTNLVAMYVGLQLFGILGLFLGPIGYLLIKECSQNGSVEDDKKGE